MKKRLVYFAILLVPMISVADSENLSKKIEELNVQSKKILGLSIRAVSELLQLEAAPFLMLEEDLNESGKLELMLELESKGYIYIKEQLGLPNGKMPERKFLWLVHSDLGKSLAEQLGD